MRNPPLLSHTGTGQFTITNYNAGKEYAVFTADGTPQAGTSVVDGVVNMGSVFGEYFVSFASDTKLSRAVKFQRARITYRTETTTSCSDNCGLCCNPNAGNGSGNCFGGGACWCGSCAADGTICCGGCYGQTCSTSSRQVKNPVPAGYTEQYGEWVRIENPVSTREVVEEKDTGLFTLPQVEWEEDYYTAVKMPVPYPATEFGEDGKPTGEVLENVPAWDYDSVYFIHYNLDGDVVWMRDNINNPECFTVVQKELMTDYEMWVSNLPAAYEGTYEFVIANENEEFVREEGNV